MCVHILDYAVWKSWNEVDAGKCEQVKCPLRCSHLTNKCFNRGWSFTWVSTNALNHLVLSCVLVHRGWSHQQQPGSSHEHEPAAALPCPQPAGTCLWTATAATSAPTTAATATAAKQGSQQIRFPEGCGWVPARSFKTNKKTFFQFEIGSVPDVEPLVITNRN